MDGQVAAAISARALAKEFRGGIKALAGVDLSVNPGEIFTYLGRNGSGKTTTVRILTTLTAPTLGTASVDGYESQPDLPFQNAPVADSPSEPGAEPHEPSVT